MDTRETQQQELFLALLFHLNININYNKKIYRGFPTRMVYLYYILCLRYTILVENPRYTSLY